MHIEQFHVTGFGRLTDWSPASPPGPGVSLFYGPNEAGKSTLRNFLLTILFGFDTKVQGRHPYNPWQGAELGGEITYSVDGDRFLLRRHLRGRTSSLELFQLPDRTPIPPAQVERLLAAHVPVSRKLYQCLFAIDLSELVPLDAETARSVQEQFATDFQTLGEIASPNEALTGLATAIEEIARRGRRGPHKALIPKLEKERRELRARERDAKSKIDEFRVKTEEHQRLEAALAELRRNRVRAENEVQRLQNLGPLRKVRERLRDLEEKRKTVAPWRGFPVDRHGELEKLFRAREIAEGIFKERTEALESARKAEKEAAEALKPFPSPNEIEAVRVVADSTRHIPGLAAQLEERQRHKNELDRRATALAHDLFPPDAPAPPAAFRKAFLDEGATTGLCRDLEKDIEAIAEIETELRKAQNRRDALTEPVRLLETEEVQLKSQKPEDYPEGFNAGRLTDATALEQLIGERPQLSARIQGHQKRREEIEQELESLSAESVGEGAGGKRGVFSWVVPGTAGAVAGIGLAIAQPGGTVGLVAGLLFLAVGALALGLGLPRILSRTADPRELLREERRRQLKQDLANSAQDADAADRELEQLDERMTRLAKRAGFDEVPESATLENTILRLRTWDAAAPAVKRLEQVRGLLAQQQEISRELHASLDTLEARATEFWNTYAERIAGFGIVPPRANDAPVERERLRRCVELAGVLSQQTRVAEEIGSAEGDIRERTNALDAAIRRWKIDIGKKDPLAKVRRLEQLVETTLEAHRTHKDSQQVLEKAEERAGSATTALEQARQALAEFLKATGCDTPEQFEKRALDAAEFARLSAEIEELRHTMPPGDAVSAVPSDRIVSPGETVNATDNDSSPDDPMDWPEEKIRDRLERLRFEEEQITAEIKTQESALTETRSALRELEEKVNIEEIRGQIEDVEDRLAQTNRRRDALVLTEYFLRESIEKFARTHRLPVLERAGDLLALVTGGRYSELQPEDAGSNALDRLTVIPAAGGRPVKMAELSRGAMEQVFLALRLALAAEMSGGRPLPVILDDVLVNADDRRLPGCIESIVRLGQEMQVFAFTCHERVAAEFERLGTPRCELPA